ncbi:hypothetical protein [Desulfitobacterium hafniense]|uniref:hypothetical protein n=1 Tax=Desulfitobacterium hafniense TaxID=49338 RepID=UPI0003124365|nr:hypothetical protein [Desulfitobacterium hafniense]
MAISKLIPDRVRKALWCFEKYQEADAALTDEDMEFIEAMCELNQAHKRLEKIRAQMTEETAKGVTV